MKTSYLLLSLLCLNFADAARAASIGVDFGAGANGSSDPDASVMSLSETAGIVAQQNWNSFAGTTQTNPQPLLLDSGTASGATVVWSCGSIWDTSVNSALDDTAGHARMMLGYLDTSDSATTTVTVANIPASFQTTGYKVIVYYDAENNANQRVGAYTLGGVTYYARDAANAVFNGTYTAAKTTTAPTGGQDNNSAQALLVPAGNYLEFTNLTASTFTLTAKASVSSDTANRAPINGIQIVQLSSGTSSGSDYHVTSPDGTVDVTVSDVNSLSYSVKMDGAAVMSDSVLGLVFQNGVKLGPGTMITGVTLSTVDTTWENQYGHRRTVPDHYNEAHFTLNTADNRTFGLYVRAYNNGVALRYELPVASGMGTFTITDELTQFRFGGDYSCRLGTPSSSAESLYSARTLSSLTSGYQGVLPLLVLPPSSPLVAVAESDLRDWAGMCLQGNGGTSTQVYLAGRADGQGKVVSTTPRVSPWRVVMLARTTTDLLQNDLVATIATPSQVADTSWIKAGACAWDPWWTGMNSNDPGGNTGTNARGTTAADKTYIDLAASMGWPYQMIDWFWYKNMTSYNKGLNSTPNANLADFTQSTSLIDIPGLISYANSKNVRLFIWAHALDVKTFGVTNTLDYIASQGFVGMKIDFFSSQAQETVQWVEGLLSAAAQRHMMIDLHGIYNATGLARTWPNFITQEGVLGNEYNKLNKNDTPSHQVSLAFTRGLLGPMDYTPGGFLNRFPANFSVTFPAQVQGTRARELALPVLYLSPLTVFCDSPANYVGKPGIEFYRNFPTVWDDSAVLTATIDGTIAVARKSGSNWRIGAIGQTSVADLSLPLSFLGSGEWELQEYTDSPISGAAATDVLDGTRVVKAGSTLATHLIGSGGYAGILKPLPAAYYAGWQSRDIGSVAAAGSFAHAGETFTLQGSGADIWGTADEFRYAYQAVFGDCEIIARVVSQQNTNVDAKAGVMIRETLNPSSSFAMNFITPNGVLAMDARNGTGSNLSLLTGSATGVAVPCWIRLSRVGNTFTSYRGTSGTGPWTELGSTTVTMASGIYIGLAVTSHADGTLSQAIFDNVSINATPLTPIGLSATASSGQVTLSWTSVPLATSYNIKRSTTLNGVYTTIVTGVTGSNYSDASVTDGTTYYYAVSGNAASESPDSTSASATPLSAIMVWRQAHFSTIANSGNAADATDPDSDGRSNLLEYATGSDPNGADAGSAAVLGKTADATRLTLTFTRIADSSLTYTVQASNNLTTALIDIWSSTGAANTAGSVTVPDTDDISANPKRFLRLRVSP